MNGIKTLESARYGFLEEDAYMDSLHAEPEERDCDICGGEGTVDPLIFKRTISPEVIEYRDGIVAYAFGTPSPDGVCRWRIFRNGSLLSIVEDGTIGDVETWIDENIHHGEDVACPSCAGGIDYER